MFSWGFSWNSQPPAKIKSQKDNQSSQHVYHYYFECLPSFLDSITWYSNKISFSLLHIVLGNRWRPLLSLRRRFRKKQNNKRANEGDCCTICVMIVIISCFKSEAGHLEHRKSVNCAFQGKKSQLKCRSSVIWCTKRLSGKKQANIFSKI